MDSSNCGQTVEEISCDYKLSHTNALLKLEEIDENHIISHNNW